MTITVSASGTQTATGGEDTLATDTTNANYTLIVDCSQMQYGDVVELRVYAGILGSTPYRLIWKDTVGATSFQSAAASSFTTASTTITVGSGLPILVGANVYDVTTGSNVGSVASYSSTTLTLAAASAINSSGSTDLLGIGSLVVQSPYVPVDQSIKVTLKQVAGTNRSYPWKLLRQ